MPNRCELSRRIAFVRSAGRTPIDIIMPPTTWMELAGGEFAPKMFDGIPVTIESGATSVVIVFPSGLESI